MQFYLTTLWWQCAASWNKLHGSGPWSLPLLLPSCSPFSAPCASSCSSASCDPAAWKWRWWVMGAPKIDKLHSLHCCCCSCMCCCRCCCCCHPIRSHSLNCCMSWGWRYSPSPCCRNWMWRVERCLAAVSALYRRCSVSRAHTPTYTHSHTPVHNLQ